MEATANTNASTHGEPSEASTDTQDARFPENTTVHAELQAYNLTVLLPPQVSTSQSKAELDNVAASESVYSVKQVLSEDPATAALTCYHLEAKAPLQGPEQTTTSASSEWERLNDYVGLESYPGIRNGSELRVVLDPYDEQKALAHVRKLRRLLRSPPIPTPSVLQAPSEDDDSAQQAASEASPATTVDSTSQTPSSSTTTTGTNTVAPTQSTTSSATTGTELSPSTQASTTEATPASSTSAETESTSTNASQKESSQGILQAVTLAQLELEDALKRLPNREMPRSDLSKFFNCRISFVGTERDFMSISPSDTSVTKANQCVRDIKFSGWNPPPLPRRMMGDLFYLEVTLVEGNTVFITAAPNGFFVNRSTPEVFDPAQAGPTKHNHCLLELLKQISPSFNKGWKKILDDAAKYAEQVTRSALTAWDALFSLAVSPASVLNPNPTLEDDSVKGPPSFTGALNSIGSGLAFGRALWLRCPNQEETSENNSTNSYLGHTYDVTRAEDELTKTWGMDERGALRDWNEEYQSVCQLPKTSVDEKVMRQRALMRTLVDFTEAASMGAQAIAKGHIMPLNPGDPPMHHVFVYNNIFFSLAMDERQRDSTQNQYVVASVDTSGAPADTSQDMACLSSASHDLQGVISMNAADVEGLHTLATVIIDYSGQRYAAQSIIPGILQGESASSLIYGSVNSGRSIASEPDMHQLILQAANQLHIAERIVKPLSESASGLSEGPSGTHEQHEQTDNSNGSLGQNSWASKDPVPLCGPVESKGILGSDGRRYILDLVRVTPRDPNWYDSEFSIVSNPAPLSVLTLDLESYSALLRPELLQHYDLYRKSVAESQQSPSNGGEETDASESNLTSAKHDRQSAADVQSGENGPPPLLLNVNSYTRFEQCVTPEEQEGDREQLKRVGSYLNDIVLPGVIRELRRGTCGAIDGDSLTEYLHRHGVNVRYTGYIAKQLCSDYACKSGFFELLETEMVARSARRVFNVLLRSTNELSSAPAVLVSTFINCMLGAPVASADKEKVVDYIPKVTGQGISQSSGGGTSSSKKIQEKEEKSASRK
eukprot:gb/GECG01001380.1/.p1 GENE.gb/GECG01001380.1/~~gb/GECG01001380.1/.p1  ORF type:complete len:1060 (+),score=160.03 gb/GECG01001380.1/:1-3180(+)